MSKGSNIRPAKVPRETYESNWDRIFTKRKGNPDMKRDNNGNGSKPDIIQAG